MIRKRTACLALLISASACTPLPQASLVYSASQQIGVGVAAGTPETPGLVVNIGFRSLNAAYVPVAVAGHCQVAGADECRELALRLLELRARHNLGTATSADALVMQNLELAITRQVVRAATLQGLIAGDENIIREIEQTTLRRIALETERSQLAGLAEATAEQRQRQTEVNSELAAIPAPAARAEADSRLSTNRLELQQVTASLTSDRTRLSEIQQRQNSQRSDATEDAFSVFGSFDGSAGGNAEGANIDVGQVFSTGVAAQHLTRGLQAAAVTTACLNAVQAIGPTIADPAQRIEFLRTGIAICRNDGQPS